MRNLRGGHEAWFLKPSSPFGLKRKWRGIANEISAPAGGISATVWQVLTLRTKISNPVLGLGVLPRHKEAQLDKASMQGEVVNSIHRCSQAPERQIPGPKAEGGWTVDLAFRLPSHACNSRTKNGENSSCKCGGMRALNRAVSPS